MQKRVTALGTLACALSLLVGQHARASYTYTTAFTPTNVAFTTPLPGVTAVTFGSSQVTVTFANQTGAGLPVPGRLTIKLDDIAVTTNNTTSLGDTVTIKYREVISITNIPQPGLAASGNLTFTGTLTLSGVNTINASKPVGANTFDQGSQSAVIGNILFILTPNTFNQPIINGAAGNLGGAVFDPAVIPAPTSIVMLGLGLAGLVLVRHGRSFRSRFDLLSPRSKVWP